MQSQRAPVTSQEREAPRGAPNILIVMTDDVGFGASSTFGGAIPTPTFDRLAVEGLRYNRFHTAAMCSPTRAALLTGRNHHNVGFGIVAELATGEPGYNSIIPDSAATIGDVLRANGYSTAWFGKNHNTPTWEKTAQGPFTRWPTGMGFDYFYGFHGGATDLGAPALVENTRLIEPPASTDYLLDRDLVDRAVIWLQTQHSLTPQRPFLLYIAPGSTHSPHRAPRDWIARFAGRFDQGWDRLREETFERQKALGVIPADAVLTPRPTEIPAWDSLSRAEQRVAARMMEVYAAQLAYFDEALGRVFDELRRTGQYDNTLVFYIQGDNGASGEGGVAGSIAETLNPERRDLDFVVSQLDAMGGPTTFQNYPVGWGWAMNTPFQWTKQVASHFGGTRNGLVISWPRGIAAHGEVRSQFAHVVDIAPTIYEAAGIPPPRTMDGVRQMPLEGESLVSTFARADAPGPRHAQYFEVFGNRAWYEDGWIASTRPGALPWRHGDAPSPLDYAWELYDLSSDYSQAHDLAAEHPDQLRRMRRRFESHAQAHQINPLTNEGGARAARNMRPYVSNGRTEFEFLPGDSRIADESFPNLLNRSWTLAARIESPLGGGAGALVTQGGWFGGWGLVMRGGKPAFVYRASHRPDELTVISASSPLSEGAHVISAQVEAEAPTPGAGARVRLLVDGREVARGRINNTVPIRLAPEGVGIGREVGTGLVEVRGVPDRFSGRVISVRIALDDTVDGGEASHDQ